MGHTEQRAISIPPDLPGLKIRTAMNERQQLHSKYGLPLRFPFSFHSATARKCKAQIQLATWR